MVCHPTATIFSATTPEASMMRAEAAVQARSLCLSVSLLMATHSVSSIRGPTTACAAGAVSVVGTCRIRSCLTCGADVGSYEAGRGRWRPPLGGAAGSGNGMTGVRPPESPCPKFIIYAYSQRQGSAPSSAPEPRLRPASPALRVRATADPRTCSGQYRRRKSSRISPGAIRRVRALPALIQEEP